ncbi:hypothetical protein TGME49_286530 [Toxoplasma gondii ME49]|uniref:Transmembrane protein n=1 Tax=Toxoplasma gondii (strain ATCC 50611 / Me49) TaxID=508771 RepID=S8GGP9_TOXGM|nr:hypothetical protein TGME49_286530 [Toxoplasma gondii ME49]EPT31015.1 hypothetical protein TGME49_286530 [Toxoplasma gondii ME49]|eukprot:XP_002369279.1 hypothetical protein TGME49_286530 [Toxoplasma gondii ME49]
MMAMSSGASALRLGCRAAPAFFCLSHRRLMFAAAPLQSFSVTNKQFHPEGLEAQAPRPHQGLDMRKIHDHKWISPFTTRVPHRSGYQYDIGKLPSLHACTHAEIASFFDVENMLQKYTLKQIGVMMIPMLNWLLMVILSILLVACPFLGFVFYEQRFEPVEHPMPRDEYFKNFKWNYWGGHLDHHAFGQYLEARRTKKWRETDVNPDDWIPPQYRGAQ